MHKHRTNGVIVTYQDCYPVERIDRQSAVLLFLVVFALCLMNFCQYPVQNQMVISLFISIVSLFSGFVFVPGDTVMAAKIFVFLKKKIEKLKDNINQHQLTCGHFPGTFLQDQASSPFLVLLWFPSGNPFPGLPVFYCPGFRHHALALREWSGVTIAGSEERRGYGS